MRSSVETPSEYLESLPNQQWKTITRVRGVILEHLSPGFVEGMQYGMLAYCVPHSLFPKGYHVNPKLPLPYVSLAAQKNHYALYLMCLYPDSELCDWFTAAWRETGKKLDMGKSCIRFKRVEDLALDVIATLLQRVTVDDYIATYEAALAAPRTRAAKKKATAAAKASKVRGDEAKPAAAKAATKPNGSKLNGSKPNGSKPNTAATKGKNTKVAAKPKTAAIKGTNTKVAAKPKAVASKSASTKVGGASNAGTSKGAKVATKPKSATSKTAASKRSNRRRA